MAKSRLKNGRFTKGSTAAKRAGRKGGKTMHKRCKQRGRK